MMHQIKTRKPDIAAQFCEDPVEWEGKWKNLHFMRDGASEISYYSYDSVAEAKKGVRKLIANLKRYDVIV